MAFSTNFAAMLSLIKNKYFMTISIFAYKGELNGKILVVCFFLVGYIYSDMTRVYSYPLWPVGVKHAFLMVASHQRKTMETSLRPGKSKDVVRAWSK